ncbi:hypothetical protein [Pectobacterium cacticida]|uniref:hypothetical protein n=1 Tax=Pectobacterium cacticida TaxID=69221 RepID=UPI0039857245
MNNARLRLALFILPLLPTLFLPLVVPPIDSIGLTQLAIPIYPVFFRYNRAKYGALVGEKKPASS